MTIDKFARRSTTALGVFLPLIAVNCAILGGTLFMVEREYTVGESAVFGIRFGRRLLRSRSSHSPRSASGSSTATCPPGLRGLGITFMITGLMAMGFMIFGGIQL